MNGLSLNGMGGEAPEQRVTHPYYQIIKDAVWNYYLWGLHKGDVEIMNFCKEMLVVFRQYDEKFLLSSNREE